MEPEEWTSPVDHVLWDKTLPPDTVGQEDFAWSALGEERAVSAVLPTKTELWQTRMDLSMTTCIERIYMHWHILLNVYIHLYQTKGGKCSTHIYQLSCHTNFPFVTTIYLTIWSFPPTIVNLPKWFSLVLFKQLGFHHNLELAHILLLNPLLSPPIIPYKFHVNHTGNSINAEWTNRIA